MNGCDYAAVSADAVHIKGAKIDEVDVGSYALIFAAGEVAVAANDAGNVCAVTVKIILSRRWSWWSRFP